MPDISVELAGVTIHVASQFQREHAESVSRRLARQHVALQRIVELTAAGALVREIAEEALSDAR